MSETKHTPGPWRLTGPDDFGDYTIQPPDAELAIAAVVNGAMNHLTGDGAQHAANARMIVAAPDLLAFVREIARRNPVFAKGDDKRVIAEARDLVSKATPSPEDASS